MQTTILIIYVAYLVIMSLAALVLFQKDKKMAIKNTEVRIKEKTLLAVSVFGGAIGAFFGRIIAHHKTNKIYFSLVIYLSVLLQLVVLGTMVFLAI